MVNKVVNPMDLKDMEESQAVYAVRLAARWAIGALLGTLGICFMASPAICATPQLVDRIVAVVNNGIIDYQELNERLTPYYEDLLGSGQPPEKIRQMLYKRRQALLNSLIDQKLILQEAKRYGLSVSDKQLDATIERMKQTNHLTDETLRKALSQQGMTMAELRHNYRNQILISRIMHIEVTSRIVVTDSDVKAYYQHHKDQYQKHRKYHLCHLMVAAPSDASDAQRQAAHEKIEAAMAALKGGKAFSQAVQRYADPQYAVDGGELGTFALDDLDPKLKKAVAPLTTGQYTPILESDQGYQILYVEKRIQPPPVPLSKVSKAIRKQLTEKLSEEQEQAWIKGLRKHAHIQIIQ